MWMLEHKNTLEIVTDNVEKVIIWLWEPFLSLLEIFYKHRKIKYFSQSNLITFVGSVLICVKKCIEDKYIGS